MMIGWPARARACAFLLSASIAAPLPTLAQERSPYELINEAAATSPVTYRQVRGRVGVLEGSGGNIAVLGGPEGVLLVDAGIAVSERKIRRALRANAPGPIRRVITTHWHWDHADGNGWVRLEGAIIMAHPATIRHLGRTLRVEEWAHTFRPVAAAARPTVAVARPTTLRFNGETVRIRPYAAGHTDGDLRVHFRTADVLALGDTYWNGAYPFIDYVGGGGIDGLIRQTETNLAAAGTDTLIIPGHGPVSGRAELVAYRNMLVDVRRRVATLKAGGRSLPEVIAAKPTAAYDARWGKSVVTPSMFTALVFRGV